MDRGHDPRLLLGPRRWPHLHHHHCHSRTGHLLQGFTKSLNWYFLGTAMYFLYGESIIYYFKHILLVDRILLPLATHHRFISFMLYIIGKTLLKRSIWRE
jgi:hypothetical protein